MVDSATVVLSSGPVGTKKTIAVLGDGFTAADQDAYNNAVNDLLLQGVFGHDYFKEDACAFNVVRVNLESTESGVSRKVYDEKGTFSDGSDDTVVSETRKDTALGFIYSGSWAHCWMESGADTEARVQRALDAWAPEYDLVVVILNETGFGGCAGGNRQVVTLSGGWSVMAHEFGHAAGGLADEYCQPGTWTYGEPGSVNITANTDRATLKWGRFVNPETPLPTGVAQTHGGGACSNWTEGARPPAWSSSDDVGLFEGASYRDTGVYRPVENCRMRGNSPPYCPVCYTALKQRHDTFAQRSFERVTVLDWNGDRTDDLLVHNDRSLDLYRAVAEGFEFVSQEIGVIDGVWPIRPGDQLLAGDLDGDGADELVIWNGADWPSPRLALMRADADGKLHVYASYVGALPGWTMRRGDHRLLADVDGDGRAELVVVNGRDWSVPFLGVLRAGSAGLTRMARHDGALPGWVMRPRDQLLAGDFDGDGHVELGVFNGHDWAIPYFGLLRWTGAGLTRTTRYDGSLPGWHMREHDQFLVGDFDGDGRADLYVFNGHDWAIPYLGMLRSAGAGLSAIRRYAGALPGWTLRRHDRLAVLDGNGDGRADLALYNPSDWAARYLGIARSTGAALQCQRVTDRVGDWPLDRRDRLEVCASGGAGSRQALVVHNHDALGLVRAGGPPSLDRMYVRWIHNYRYGKNW